MPVGANSDVDLQRMRSGVHRDRDITDGSCMNTLNIRSLAIIPKRRDSDSERTLMRVAQDRRRDVRFANENFRRAKYLSRSAY